jgi:hypothetical protein
MKTVEFNSAEIEFLNQAIDVYAMAGLHGAEIERVRGLRAKLRLNGNAGEGWMQLESTNLKRCRYNHDSARLEITFHNGAEWIYLDVPPSIYEDLIEAESAGKFFGAEIKPHYEGVPKPEDDADEGSD